MKKFILAFLLLLAGLSCPNVTAESSYSQWLASRKAAHDAFRREEFHRALEILEPISHQAASIGELAMSEHAILFSLALARIGKFVEAHAAIAAALDEIGPNPPAKRSQALRGLLIASRATVYYLAKNHDAALESARQSLAVLESAVGKFHSANYLLHGIIGEIQESKKNYAEAEKAYKAAFSLAPGRVIATDDFAVFTSGPFGNGVVAACRSLVNLYSSQGRFAEAKPYAKRAVEAAGAYGKKSAPVAHALAQLARINLQLSEAKDFHANEKRLHALILKIPHLNLRVTDPYWDKFAIEWNAPKTHSNDAIAKILSVYAAQGFSWDDAAARALNIAQGDRPDNWDRAVAVQDAFRAKAQTVFADNPAQFAGLITGFAKVARERKQFDLARVNYGELLKNAEAANDTLAITVVLGHLAEVALEEGKPRDALPHRQRIRLLLGAKYGDDLRVTQAMQDEAALLRDLGRENEAARLEAQGAEIFKKSLLKK